MNLRRFVTLSIFIVFFTSGIRYSNSPGQRLTGTS